MSTPAPRPPRRHPLTACAAAASTLLLATACGTNAAETPQEPQQATVVDDDRCATNRAIGTVTYLTGYQYQSSVSILEAVAADALGYFDRLCLDVEIAPGSGNTIGNARSVADGGVQFTSLGNEGEIIQANEQGIGIVGIATYGHVGIANLMTPKGVDELTDLEGTVLGHKGMLPPPVAAMLVSEGVDLDEIEQELVGYDPSILPAGEVDSLTGYRSNEPFLLEAMGAQFIEWLPEQFGVAGSFGVMATSPDFADAHPTAVEDFLRAMAQAFEYCQENARECVEYAAALDAENPESYGYDVDHNLRIWDAEQELVSSYTVEGKPLGYIDLNKTEEEAAILKEYGQLEEIPDLEPFFRPTFIEAVHIAGEVSWPEGG
ncbi:ABC transporter substrate-binding protein [Nocardiopsis sp. CNT312]|uniref:ABC transporter substrate-binding protein n=1 Tax=Nocardiopsis sp. CNT312 TaxID=1137268 RepID=UPI000491BB36|nr:ABC transporter substrate-binding protein [Nocardiopsis sp. CNT312]